MKHEEALKLEPGDRVLIRDFGGLAGPFELARYDAFNRHVYFKTQGGPYSLNDVLLEKGSPAWKKAQAEK